MSNENPSDADLRPSSRAKRDAILDAATRAFFEEGFAGASIESIAQEAGVSKVTVYNHFGDKTGIFTAAVERECELMRGAFDVVPDLSGTLRERLTTIGETMVAFLGRPKMVQFERRVAAETERHPDVGRAFLETGPHRMRAAFAALLRAMDAAGEVRVADAELAAEQFASMCKGMGDLDKRFGAAPDPQRDRERIAGAVEVFCRAYATGDTSG